MKPQNKNKKKQKKVVPYFGYKIPYTKEVVYIGVAKCSLEQRGKNTITNVNGKRYSLKELYDAIP